MQASLDKRTMFHDVFKWSITCPVMVTKIKSLYELNLRVHHGHKDIREHMKNRRMSLFVTFLGLSSFIRAESSMAVMTKE